MDKRNKFTIMNNRKAPEEPALFYVDTEPTKPAPRKLQIDPLDADAVRERYGERLNKLPREAAPLATSKERREMALRLREEAKIKKGLLKKGMDEGTEKYKAALEKGLEVFDGKRAKIKDRQIVTKKKNMEAHRAQVLREGLYNPRNRERDALPMHPDRARLQTMNTFRTVEMK